MARIKISAKELLLHGADFGWQASVADFPRMPWHWKPLELRFGPLNFVAYIRPQKKWHLQVPEMAISCVEMGMVFHEFLAWGSL